MEGLAVLQGDRFRRGENAVEFPDCAQGVHVGRIPMIVLVLDEAGESVELGHEAPEHAELVHPGEHGFNRAHFAEDRAEADGGVGGGRHLSGKEGQGFADEFPQVQVRWGVEGLAVAEDADEADRILLEDRRLVSGQFPSPDDEAV